MATQAYYTWRNAGSPWRLATPIAELQTWAKANGVSILGTIGNQDHLVAEPPQDHTPFSATAWPVPLPGFVVTAIDLADTNGLGQAILTQARAGKLPWLKYVIFANKVYSHWDNFQEGKYNSDSHVHMSIRSDWCDTSIGTFDPQSSTPAPAPAPAPTASGLPHFANGSRTLSLKSPVMRGTDVRALQLFIGESWCGKADGEYGPKTVAGVKRYQAMRGLKVDGIAGPKTWAPIFKVIGK